MRDNVCHCEEEEEKKKRGREKKIVMQALEK